LRKRKTTANLENFPIKIKNTQIYYVFKSPPKQRKVGERIKRLFVSLSLCAIMALLISTACVKAQQLPELPSIEDMDLDITLELLPDARCHVTASAETQFEGMEWSELPITSGSVELEISSPNSGQLKLDVDASATLSGSLLAEIPDEISTMNVEMINDLIEFLGVEGQSLSELLSGVLPMAPEDDIVIEELRCTKFSWNEPTIEAGLTTTLSGGVFEDQTLLDELPITVDVSIDISEVSTNVSIDVNSETVEFTFEINLTTEDTTTTMELTLDGYFKLPVVDNQVQWGFELPEIVPTTLGESFEQYDTDFTLKVPEDASVSGLPSGYSQTGDTYTWSGGDAADALNTVLGGETQPNIVYGYEALPSEFPWLTVGILVVVIVAIAAAIVLIRR
jgi:hypothetical protein